MTTGKKSLLTIVMSVVMALAIVAGCLSFVNTKTVNASSVAPTFETVEGAWIRTHEVEERFGIKFQIRMDSEEYNTFLSTYSDVEFGMFIMPEDYRASKGEFTEANLFGNEVYCWEGNMVEGKTEILNMAQAEMPEVDGAYNYLEFAITNVKPENVTRPFAGVGYIKYNDGESVKYVIDDNGAAAARSIAQVAQDAKAGELPESVVAVLDKILAVKPAVEVTADYNADAISTAVNALDYAIGEELDITAIAEENAPEGYKVDTANSTLVATIPAKGVASFAVSYVKDYNLSGDSTGNIVKTACADGIVYSYSKSNNNKVFFDDTSSIHFWTHVNSENAIVFDREFVKQAKEAGYTQLKIVYSVTITTTVGGSVRLSKLNGSSFTEIGDVKGSISSTITDNEVVINIDYSKVDLAAGETLAIGKTAAGNHDPLKIIISHLEFTKPEDITKITGNIAGVAVDKGIVTLHSGGTSLSNKNGTTEFKVGYDLRDYLLFDSRYVKAQYEKGYNLIKITMSVTTAVTTNGTPNLVHHDASAKKLIDLPAAGEFPKITVGSVYPQTVIFTLTEEMIKSFDFETGDKLRFGNFDASKQNGFKVTLSHIEFGNEWSFVDYTQNMVAQFTGNVGVNATNDFGYIGGYTGNAADNWIYSSSSEGVVTKINMLRTASVANRVYIEKEYVANAIANGYTILKISYKWDSRGKAVPTIREGVGDDFTQLGATISKITEETENDIYVRTYDLTSFNIDNCLIINHQDAAPTCIFLYEISFAKPAQA